MLYTSSGGGAVGGAKPSAPAVAAVAESSGSLAPPSSSLLSPSYGNVIHVHVHTYMYNVLPSGSTNVHVLQEYYMYSRHVHVLYNVISV